MQQDLLDNRNRHGNGHGKGNESVDKANVRGNIDTDNRLGNGHMDMVKKNGNGVDRNAEDELGSIYVSTVVLNDRLSNVAGVSGDQHSCSNPCDNPSDNPSDNPIDNPKDNPKDNTLDHEDCDVEDFGFDSEGSFSPTQMPIGIIDKTVSCLMDQCYDRST